MFPHDLEAPAHARGFLCSLSGGELARFAVQDQFKGLLPSQSAPAEKATARQDQAGQASTGDGAGSRHIQRASGWSRFLSEIVSIKNSLEPPAN